jgi:hypothetical protein
MMFTELTWFSGREVARTNDLEHPQISIDIDEVRNFPN